MEDEPMLLLALEDMIGELGCEAIPSKGGLKGALRYARELPLDAAVLDVNLAGERVDPVADALAERGVPFVFASGYTATGLPQRHQGRPVVEKPYDREQLLAALMLCVDTNSPHGA